MELYPCLFEKFLNSIDLDLDPYQFINLTNLTVNTFINIYLLSISFYTEIPLNLLLDISSNKINDNYNLTVKSVFKLLTIKNDLNFNFI